MTYQRHPKSSKNGAWDPLGAISVPKMLPEHLPDKILEHFGLFFILFTEFRLVFGCCLMRHLWREGQPCDLSDPPSSVIHPGIQVPSIQVPSVQLQGIRKL